MNNDNLIDKINVFGSNALTRMISRQKLKPFGGDRRKYKYRVGLLTAFADLENTLEDFEASVLGSSGKSIFMSIQYLANAKRQLAKISGILKAYSAQEQNESLPLNNVNESKVEDDNLNEIIKDFDINKLNFDYAESNKFSQLEQLIAAYNSGNQEATDQIKLIYKQLVNELSKGNPSTSLEDVLITRANDSNNLESRASFSNWLKKWYGKARHHISMFDETSPIRVDVSNLVKESLDDVQDALNSLEKDLDPYEIFEKIASINSSLDSTNNIMQPLIESIHGSSFGNTFLKMVEKNKLTDFPSNLSDKEKQSFQTYLKTREFKDLLNMYSGEQ